MPVIVVVALALGAFTGDSDPDPTPTRNPAGAITAADPPRADVDAAACAQVLAQLPITLGPLKQRVVRTPTSPFVVAWGDPAVILRCGQKRPADLKPGDGNPFQNAGSLAGPYFEVDSGPDGSNVWTSVDRAAYISVTIPRDYQGGEIMPPLAAAIAKALPAVCSTLDTAPLETLCTRRK